MDQVVSQPDWLPGAIRNRGLEQSFKAGHALFRQGNRTVGLYEVVSGRVRLVRVDRSGREVLLHSAAGGETIAEASLFSPTYHCDAIATTNAMVKQYPKAAILAEFEVNPKVARAFMTMLARQVMSLRTSLEQRNIHSAVDRIRHYLAVHAGPDGRSVILPGSLKELAASLGLAHEVVYRRLAEMQADGEIERLKGKIRLLQSPYDRDHT